MKDFKPWVRKLTGKPGGHTSPDCEFEARRIHGFSYETVSISAVAARTAFLIHSDLLPGDLAIAARTRLASSGRSLNTTRTDRFSDFGTLGLPILSFIKLLV